MSEPTENLTKLLIKASRGNKDSLDEILPLVYGELRKIVQNYLNRERSDHTLQATALVHEAYLRLIDQQKKEKALEYNLIAKDIGQKIAADDAENLGAKYGVASIQDIYADFLEKNNRLPEAFEYRQKTLEFIVPLEKAGNNPDYFIADFFSFYGKSARTAAKPGKKDLAEKYIQKAESLNFQIEKMTGEVRNLYPEDFFALGDAYTIL